MSSLDVLTAEPFWTVKPKPAFCVKLRHKTEAGKEEKIFLNFCTCNELPPPVDDIDEDRLAVILESSDPGSYRIPISVGEAHSEEDNRGQPCIAYDIILNERFYTKRVVDSELFRTFLILVAIDAVESKHGLREIDRQNWVVLKNRKCIGELQAQNIRKQPKPMIQVLDGGDKSKGSQVQVATSTKSAISLKEFPKVGTSTKSMPLLKPRYEIRKNDATNPTKITATFQLEGVKSRSDIDLDVGEHRIRVIAAKVNYSEDVFVSMSLDQQGVKAKFLLDEEKLVVEIPLIK